ncbi:hypothetical protein AB4Z22_15490 [Paenibacillus sp. TAF58]
MNAKLLYVSLISTLFLSACGKDIGKEIEADLLTITTDPMSQLSSNPGTYISSQRKSYDDIVNHGDAALVYLTQTLKASEKNGLKEWIMAYACTDILGEKNPVKAWGNGKEWQASYEMLSKEK